jgi:NhaP-type Na+/H+ or K+/H+ antiporter
MEIAIAILGLGVLVFAGHFLTGFFARTKVPDVLILMLAGIVLGPVLKIVTPEHFGQVGPVFTTIALIVILFEGGIHLRFKELVGAARDTLLISVATFAVTVLLIAYLADLLLPVDPITALLIGTILGGTSSAVVVPMIRILPMASRPQTVLLLESALTDVLAVVLGLGLMRTLTPGQSVSAGLVAGEVAEKFLMGAAVGAAGAFIWSAILPKVRQFPNTIFTTVAYVLILYGLTEWWEYSGAIAALTFGIAVANLQSIPDRIMGKIFNFRLVGFAEVERTFFAEVVFLVKTFFFVFLGISISFADWRIFAVGFGLSVVAFVGRMVMVRLLASRDFARRDTLLMTALIPKGLAAAVLASLPAQRGLPNGEVIQDTVYAVIFLSITMCAILVFVIEGGGLDRFAARFFRPYPDERPVQQTPSAPVAAFDQSLGLPAMTEDWQEPNPVQLDDPVGVVTPSPEVTPDGPKTDGSVTGE